MQCTTTADTSMQIIFQKGRHAPQEYSQTNCLHHSLQSLHISSLSSVAWGRCPIWCIRGRPHPQRICGISGRVHHHCQCTRKNHHVDNKYNMELIKYPTPHHKRRAADNGNTAVAIIGIICNERSRSLSRKDQGSCHQVL